MRRLLITALGAVTLSQAVPALSANDPAADILKQFGVQGIPSMAVSDDETSIPATGERGMKVLLDCYAKFNDPKTGQLGPAHITNSPKWGYVLRADFLRKGESAPAFRLLC